MADLEFDDFEGDYGVPNYGRLMCVWTGPSGWSTWPGPSVR